MSWRSVYVLGLLSILTGTSCRDDVVLVPCTSQTVGVFYGQVATFPCNYSRTAQDGCGDDSCYFSMGRSDGAVVFSQGGGFDTTHDIFAQLPDHYVCSQRVIGTTTAGRMFALYYVPEAESPCTYAFGVIVVESPTGGFEESLHVQYMDTALDEVLAIAATITYE